MDASEHALTQQTTAAIKGFLGYAITHASHEKHIATPSKQFFHCEMQGHRSCYEILVPYQVHAGFSYY